MGPLAPIRAFSDQYQGECIEHSLKQTEIPNFKGNSHPEFKGDSHTCQYFAAAQACYIAKKGAIQHAIYQCYLAFLRVLGSCYIAWYLAVFRLNTMLYSFWVLYTCAM